MGHLLPKRDVNIWEKRIFPTLQALFRVGYFSLTIEGQDNIPKKGRVIFAPNHAGWFTLDSFIFAFAVKEVAGANRIPYAIVHDILFKVPGLRRIFKNLGVIPASWLHDLDDLPKNLSSLGIYPEGSDGNCKPFWEAYRMKPWHTGVVRLAIAQKSSIIPVAIVGGEESVPVGWPVGFVKRFLGTKFPIPLTPIPLPTHWKVVFHKPMRFTQVNKNILTHPNDIKNATHKIQSVVQGTLNQETSNRWFSQLSNFLH